MAADRIAVVVIGRNEEQRLARCLSSLGASDLTYVDSGSTDRSVEIAEQFGARVVRLDPKIPFSAARGRNEGFGAVIEANPDVRFVQFVDGDCELDVNWLGKAVAFLEAHPNVAAVCGRRRELFPDETVFNKLCDVEWDTPPGEAVATGGDFLVRVSHFRKIGGFRSSLVAGEEPEMCARLREQGFSIWRLDAEMTRHDVALRSFRQWWRRTVRSGYGYAEVSRTLRLSPCRIYWPEVRRAIVWAGILPLSIIAISSVYPMAAWLLLLYPLQLVRIAVRSKRRIATPYTYAFFMMVAKFAELQGILAFELSRISGQFTRPREYKSAPSI